MRERKLDFVGGVTVGFPNAIGVSRRDVWRDMSVFFTEVKEPVEGWNGITFERVTFSFSSSIVLLLPSALADGLGAASMIPPTLISIELRGFLFTIVLYGIGSGTMIHMSSFHKSSADVKAYYIPKCAVCERVGE